MKKRDLYKYMVRLIVLVSLVGCDGKGPSRSNNGPGGNRIDEVEVAPGEWLSLEGEDDRAWFRCQWNGKTIYWSGNYRMANNEYYDSQIPVSLRSWEGLLFLIYEEWIFPDIRRFGYATLDASGTRFETLSKVEYPRQVATQNIGVDQEAILHDENGKEVERLKIFRELNIGSPYFRNSTTSRIWYDLEKGLRQQEMRDSPAENAVFYKGFVEKYHPIPLPTLIREDQEK